MVLPYQKSPAHATWLPTRSSNWSIWMFAVGMFCITSQYSMPVNTLTGVSSSTRPPAAMGPEPSHCVPTPATLIAEAIPHCPPGGPAHACASESATTVMSRSTVNVVAMVWGEPSASGEGAVSEPMVLFDGSAAGSTPVEVVVASQLEPSRVTRSSGW